MKKLKFTAFLKTPIIFRGYLTFDALLAGILFDRIDDPAKAHESIPIKHTDGLFHASAAVVEGFNHIEKVSFSASLKAKHDLDPQLFKQNKSGTGPHRTLGEKRRRDFGNVLSTYNAIHAQAVSWHCEGDEPAISDLLKDARYIGK
ncbi:MAG: hypothetical protein ACR2PJ_06030, partial [Pseudomonadales bacterium]